MSPHFYLKAAKGGKEGREMRGKRRDEAGGEERDEAMHRSCLERQP